MVAIAGHAGGIDGATNFPAGDLICPADDVSWPPSLGPDCWVCSRRGLTSADYAQQIRSSR